MLRRVSELLHGIHRLTQINVYSAGEETAKNLDDIFALHAQTTGQRERPGDVLGLDHGPLHALFKVGQLCALRNCMGDGQFYHMIAAAEREPDRLVGVKGGCQLTCRCKCVAAARADCTRNGTPRFQNPFPAEAGSKETRRTRRSQSPNRQDSLSLGAP